MRLIRIAALGILLCLPMSAAWADGNGVGFGNAYCSGTVPCAPDASSLPSIVANATACVGDYFGFRGSPFDPSAPLDGGNCLQPTSSANNAGSGLTMSAHCCIVQGENNVCRIQCQLIGNH